jgi:hypothetical protein
LISDECQKPKRRSGTNCILLGSHTHKISTDYQSDEEEVTKSNKPKIDIQRSTEKQAKQRQFVKLPMYYSNLDKTQYLGDDIFVFVFLK